MQNTVYVTVETSKERKTMEQLVHLFSVISYLNFFIYASACLAIIFCIISYLKGNNPFTSQIWDNLPTYAMIIIGIATLVVQQGAISQLSSQLAETYEITLDKSELNEIMPMDFSHPVIHKFIATMENDPRVYEIYLTHTDQGYNLATKNVTGVYMPLTKMTKQTLIKENQ